MRRGIILVFAWIFTISFVQLLAAKSASDSLYLTNNNLLIGKVYKYIPDKYLCIQTPEGQFTFELSDVKKLAIHSVANYQDGIDEDLIPIKNDSEPEPVVYMPQKTTSVIVSSSPTISGRPKIAASGRSAMADELYVPSYLSRSSSFYGDHFADNIFILQTQLSWSDKTPLLKKIQTIYARRIEQDVAIGGGMNFGTYGQDTKLVNAFCDVRKFLFVNNHYHSLAADFGISASDSEGSPYICVSYNIGIRLQGITFLQFGIHYSQERYGLYGYEYQDGYSYRYHSSNLHRNVGINAGIVF